MRRCSIAVQICGLGCSDIYKSFWQRIRNPAAIAYGRRDAKRARAVPVSHDNSRHPLGGIGSQFPGILLELGQVVERIGSARLAGVDQAHEQVAYLRAVLRSLEQPPASMLVQPVRCR